jgi:hypothetical protein
MRMKDVAGRRRSRVASGPVLNARAANRFHTPQPGGARERRPNRASNSR